MVEQPGRSTYQRDDRADPDDDEQGWGSPVPAEYGSLRAVLPPIDEDDRPAPRVETHDRWAVTSLLRRIQGEGNGAVVVPDPAEPSTTPGPKGPRLVPRPEPEPAAVAPAPEPQPEPAAEPAAEPAPERRPRTRPRSARARTRATVRHLDILTVLRVSVIFWLVMLIAVVVAAVLLWLFADAFGSLPTIERSVRTLFSLKSFKLHPAQVAFYTALGGAVIAVAGILANVLFALIYNLIADVVGGVRVELESSSSE